MGFALLALFGAWAAKCLGSDVPDRNESVNWIVERPIDTDFSEDVPQRAPDTASEAPPMIRVAPGSSMSTLASGLWTASSNTFTDSLYGATPPARCGWWSARAEQSTPPSMALIGFPVQAAQGNSY